jgi:glycosyltransferase involved in cell wall biosynthesis
VSDAAEVTVVIPTRDRRARLMQNGLASALGQEDVDLEVVVVDDGSEDGTAEELSQLEEARLRVVRHERSRGVAQARNAGIAAARGEWVAFLDDDDVWSPHKLRRQIDTAQAVSAGWVYASVVSVDEAGGVNYAFPVPTPDGLARELLARSVVPAGCSNVVARTELVRELGGFDEQLFQLADWDLWIRLAQAASAAACPEVLVGYVEHPQNMLLTDERDVTKELELLEEKHRGLRAAHGVELDRATFMHWVAWGQLRRGRRLGAARVYLRCGLQQRRPRDLVLAAAFALRSVVPIRSARRLLQAVAPPRGVQMAAQAAPPGWIARYR